MGIVNSVFNTIFDGFFALAGLLGGTVTFWLLSAIVGVVFIYIFKVTSNQKGIRLTKDRIAASFLEVRLFKDDLGQMMRAQGRIFTSGFRYMGHAFKPLLFMMIPFFVIAIQINMWYGFEPLVPDSQDIPLQGMFDANDMTYDVPLHSSKSALVTARLDNAYIKSMEQDGGDSDGAWARELDIELVADEGIEVVTPALRIGALNEVNWRIRAIAEGEHELTVKIGDKKLSQTVFVGSTGQLRKIQPVLVRGAWAEFWNPGSPAIPSDIPLVEFSVNYPEQQFNLLGWNVHWIIALLILSLIFGFSLKGVLGVEI